MRTVEQILASIVADVEAMHYEVDGDHKFGPFEEWNQVVDTGVSVTWPNLGILIEEAKERLNK